MLPVPSLPLPGPPVQSRALFPSAAAQEKGPLAFVSTHPGIACEGLRSEERKKVESGEMQMQWKNVKSENSERN